MAKKICKTCKKEIKGKFCYNCQPEEYFKDFEKCFCDGISNCCRVPIDDSLVISEGKYKNHGPRYCSKCKRLLYQI